MDYGSSAIRIGSYNKTTENFENHQEIITQNLDSTIQNQENIVEKIAQGKLQKFFKENTLLSQSFVKDSSLSVEKYISSYSSDLKVESFLRISIG